MACKPAYVIVSLSWNFQIWAFYETNNETATFCYENCNGTFYNIKLSASDTYLLTSLFMWYDNDNDEQRQMHIILHDVTVYFNSLFILKYIQLSTLASAVIKLNHSVIIFPGKWRSGNRLYGKRLVCEKPYGKRLSGIRLSGKMTIRESYYQGKLLSGKRLYPLHWHLGDILLRSISFFGYLMFFVCNAAVHYLINYVLHLCSAHDKNIMQPA